MSNLRTITEQYIAKDIRKYDLTMLLCYILNCHVLYKSSH